MKNQADKYYDQIVTDLGTLLTDIQAAMSAVLPGSKQAGDLTVLFFGEQELMANLPSPPVDLDSLVVAALRVNGFCERSLILIGTETFTTNISGDCTTIQTDAQKALEYAYQNQGASDELSFAQLQAAVDGLETQKITTHKSFEHAVISGLTVANKSLKALQKTGFQPTQLQVGAYERAWFDVTERLDAKAEKKGQQREHIASLVDIRDGLSTLTNRLGVLAETSVGIDIPEF